jgi:hypothetical protein
LFAELSVWRGSREKEFKERSQDSESRSQEAPLHAFTRFSAFWFLILELYNFLNSSNS